MVTQAAKKPNGTARESAVLRLTTRKGETIGWVSVDGTMYELANPAHFGLREAGTIGRAMTRIAELEALAELEATTDEQEVEYHDRLLQVARAVLPGAPIEALTKLASGALSELVVHFFGTAASLSPRLQMITRTPVPTGTTSSRSSRGSTAAIPGSG